MNENIKERISKMSHIQPLNQNMIIEGLDLLKKKTDFKEKWSSAKGQEG